MRYDKSIYQQRAERFDQLNVPQNKTALRARRVLEFLISQPTISTEEIGKQLGVTGKTVKRAIDSLRGLYSIKWIGPSKSGRWEIHELK